MDILKTFLEQQPLFSLFLVIGLGYAIGGVNIRGFSLGAGAVLFVGLVTGMFAPKSAGRVKCVGAIYEIETGRVRFLEA